MLGVIGPFVSHDIDRLRSRGSSVDIDSSIPERELLTPLFGKFKISTFAHRTKFGANFKVAVKKSI